MFAFVISMILFSSIFLVPSAAAAIPASVSVHAVTTPNTLGAGYAVSSSNGSITGVFISFTIPKVSCSATNPSGQGVAIVAGLDGLDSSDYENVGVLAHCQQGPNSPEYFAISTGYYSSIEGVVPVSAGNVIYAGITVSGDMFHYTFRDVSTGKSASDSSPATGTALNFAECMVTGIGIPLSKFSPVSVGKAFTDVPNTCDATVRGVTHPIGGFGSKASLYKLVLVSSTSTDILATPSTLSDGGTSFMVTWRNAS